MNTMTLGVAGLVEIDGAEIRGGAMIGPAALLIPLYVACVGAIANNWSAFKQEFAASFSAGASGNW